VVRLRTIRHGPKSSCQKLIGHLSEAGLANAVRKGKKLDRISKQSIKPKISKDCPCAPKAQSLEIFEETAGTF
jgi:hypothetical protein